MAQSFDAATATVSGGAFPVAEGVGPAGNTGFGAFSARAGMLAYAELLRPQKDLVWLSRSGEVLAPAVAPGAFNSMDVCPDRSRAVVSVSRDRTDVVGEILMYDLESGRSTPFASGSPGWANPIWSNDGTRVAYSTYGNSGLAEYEIRVKPADMASDEADALALVLEALASF